MAGNQMDFKLRFKAETADFSKAIAQINSQLKGLNQRIDIRQNVSGGNSDGQATKQAARDKAVLAQSVAAEEKRIADLRIRAEKQAAAEAKRAATERTRAEREHSRTAKMLARELERERVQSERNSVQAAKQAAREKVAAVRQAAGSARESVRALNAEMEKTATVSKTAMAESVGSIGRLGKAALGAAAGIAGISIGMREVVEATRQFQALQTKFEYAFDGAGKGAEQLKFIREEANRLGLEFTSAANGYAQLASATKNLNLSAEQTQQIFTGVASAVAGMGLSADEANGVFLALSQIAGKGKVSMEELRGQLGERLTPAMGIAAKSMGVTVAELEKMVEQGISAEKFLPKFGAALEGAFSETAAKNAGTLNGQINLLKNRYNEFLLAVDKGGVGQAAAKVFQDIGAALEVAQKNLDGFLNSSDGTQLQAALQQVYELLKHIGNTAVGVFKTLYNGVGDISSALAGGEQKVSLLQGALNGVSIAMAAIGDGVSAVRIAFDLFSGAAKDLLSMLAMGLSKLSFGDVAAGLEQMALDLNDSARKNYAAAEQQAQQFDSSLRRVLGNIAETGNAAGAAYQPAIEAAEKAAQAAEKHAEALTAEQQAAAQSEQQFKKAQAAAAELGADMTAATQAVGAATKNALDNVQVLADSFDVLKGKSVDAALLIRQALSESLKKAANEQDIAAIKAKFEELGQSGKLAMQDVESGILAADVRLQELRGNIDPTTAALKKLGIQSKESLHLSGEAMRQAYELAVKSGQVSQGELKKAFENTAKAMLESGDNAQAAWVKSQAGAHGYRVAVDETGKAALQAAKKTQAAAQQQANAHQGAAHAVEKQAESVERSAERSSRAIERQSSGISEFGRKAEQAYAKLTNPSGRYSMDVAMSNITRIAAGQWAVFVKQMQAVRAESQSVLKDLAQSLQSGVNLAANLARAEYMARENADKLDKATLSGLRAKIDQARQQMQALADEAANARTEAEKELLTAQGDEARIAQLEQQQKMQQLQRKQEEAERAGHSGAASDYAAAGAAVQAAFAERQRKAAQEKLDADLKRVTEEKAAREAEAQKVQAALDEMPKIDLGLLDFGDFAKLLGGRDQQIAEIVKQAIMSEIAKQVKNRT